jgi:hypothetical protein
MDRSGRQENAKLSKKPIHNLKTSKSNSTSKLAKIDDGSQSRPDNLRNDQSGSQWQ